MKKAIAVYFILSCFVVGWWILAFKSTSKKTTYPFYSNLTLQTSALFPYLSSLEREAIHQALAGDTKQMLRLITEWDVDAQILSEKGVPDIQRLDPGNYLQAHLLNRLLHDSAHPCNQELRAPFLIDDMGHYVALNVNDKRFFPQTFAAASILMAITPASEIVAIPKGMRELSHVYPSAKMAQIASNMQDMHGEKLFISQPDLTFVSPYSHPPTLEALRNQHQELYTIKNINSLADIRETILKIGHASNHVLEANLLNLFVDASLLMIDNRFKALYAFYDQPQTFLFLYQNQHYTLPTTKSLAGQLLQRVLHHYPTLQCPLIDDGQNWRSPFEQEKIVQMNPHCLLIAQPYPLFHSEQVQLVNTFKDIQAYKNHLIFVLDETVQESPDQYLVLAYFDLFQALAAAHLP